jgi:photosystem II stability/assembly factor-like uncharacterized protein
MLPSRRRIVGFLVLASSALFSAPLPAAPPPAGAGVWREIGPEGGTVVQLAASPAATGTIYAVAGDGSIFRSSDGASSWAPSGRLDLFSPGSGPHLSVDASSSSTLYIPGPGFVEKSTDGGASWSHLPLPGDQGGTPAVLTISPSAPQVLYAALDSSMIYRSRDGGASWQALAGPFFPPELLSLAVDAADPNRLYLSTDGFVFFSLDGGQQWTMGTVGNAFSDTDRLSLLAADLAHPATVYGVVTDQSDNEALWKSVDGGATWAKGAALPSYAVALQVGRSGVVTLVLRSAVAGSTSLYRSVDGGATLQAVGPLPPLAPGDDPVFAADPSAKGPLYAGEAHGIARSLDGGQSWAEANRGFTPRSFPELIADPRTSGALYATSTLDPPAWPAVTVTLDGGGSWALADSSSPASSILRLARDARHGVLFVVSQVVQTTFGSIDVFRSLDDGATWIESGPSLFSQPSAFPLDLLYAQGSPGLLYGLVSFPVGCPSGTPDCVASAVVRSENRGRHWEVESWSAPVPAAFPVARLWTPPASPTTVYASFSLVAGQGTLRKSLDGGITWTQLAVSRQVVDAAFDPRAANTLYIALAGPRRQVLESIDGGATWQAAYVGLPRGVEVTALAFDPTSPPTLFAGTAGAGVFASTDGGKSWQPAGQGLPAMPVISLAADGQGEVYAGTLSAGVYALSRH